LPYFDFPSATAPGVALPPASMQVVPLERALYCLSQQISPSPFFLLTSGSLPRIDVIGYNPRVDWNVLMERLGRISTSDEVIIE
jgi:hypothetical protein